MGSTADFPTNVVVLLTIICSSSFSTIPAPLLLLIKVDSAAVIWDVGSFKNKSVVNNNI